MKTITLRGIVLKIIKQGSDRTIVVFKDRQAGKLILGIDRTLKLFYEVQEGMLLSVTASVSGITDKKNRTLNAIDVTTYKKIEAQGGE